MADHSHIEPCLSAFYLPLKNDVKHFSSIIGILDKLELDKNLELLGMSFSRIIDSELSYAVVGRISRAPETQGNNPCSRHPRAADHKHSNFQGQPEGHFRQSQFAYQSSLCGASKSAFLKSATRNTTALSDRDRAVRREWRRSWRSTKTASRRTKRLGSMMERRGSGQTSSVPDTGQRAQTRLIS